MQKHSQHNKDERTQFFRKIYLSLYSKGLWKDYERVIVWEASWRLNKDCNTLTPTPLAIAAFLSHSPGLLNRRPGGPALRSLVLTARTRTLTSNSDLQLIIFLSNPGYISNWHPPASCERHNSHSILPVDSQGYPPISWTGCTCYLHWCISHLTFRPGRRLVCYNVKICIHTYIYLCVCIYIYIYIHFEIHLNRFY